MYKHLIPYTQSGLEPAIFWLRSCWNDLGTKPELSEFPPLDHFSLKPVDVPILLAYKYVGALH
jgi:hypothetical protein